MPLTLLLSCQASRRFLADRLVDALQRIDELALWAAEQARWREACEVYEARLALAVEALGERSHRVSTRGVLFLRLQGGGGSFCDSRGGRERGSVLACSVDSGGDICPLSIGRGAGGRVGRGQGRLPSAVPGRGGQAGSAAGPASRCRLEARQRKRRPWG